MIEKLVLVAPTGMMTHSNPAMQQYIINLVHGNCWLLSPYYVDTSLVPPLYRYYMIHDSNNVVLPEELVRNYSNVQRLPHARRAFISTILELGLVRKQEDGRLIPKLKGRLSQINCPTLIVGGDNGKMVPTGYSKYFLDEIPNCELHTIGGCGHIPHIEKPIEFSRIIQDFLS